MSTTPFCLEEGEGVLACALEKAVRVLSEGGVVLYPTETLYALGVDVENKEALARLRMLKGRTETHPFLALVADEMMAKEYVSFTPLAERVSATFLHHYPLTLVLTALPDKMLVLKNEEGSVGVRFSTHSFCRALAKAFGRPIVSTSANHTGDPTKETCIQVLEDFKDSVGEIGCAVDGGVCAGKASTILEVSGEKIHLLREGALSRKLLCSAGFSVV